MRHCPLRSGLSCESSSPDVSVLLSCVIAGSFHGPGQTHACAARCRCAECVHKGLRKLRKGGECRQGHTCRPREQRQRYFCVGSRTSVVLNNAMVLRSADLSELVRARRGIFAPNAYAMGDANAKREQSATKSTPAGQTSNGAVAFLGGTGERLSPAFRAVSCVGTVMEMSETSLQAQMCMCTPSETTVASSPPAKPTARQRTSVLVCAQSWQRSDAQKVSCDQRPAVCGRGESLRTNPPLLTLPTVLFIWASLSSSCFIFSKTMLRLLFECFRDFPKW